MLKNKKIILASGSPRRIEMMKSHGIHPIIIPADISENIPPKSGMCETPMFLALKKAQAAEKIYLNSLSGISTPDESITPENISLEAESTKGGCSQATLSDKPAIIIAADTIVYKDGEIMGKPANSDDGIRMLDKLRNTYHYVITGVALLAAGSKSIRVFAEITKVYFKDYRREEIMDYLTTDEAYDKAGAYAIQGYFSKHIDHIEGSLENVIGFPWDRIEKEIELL